MKLSLIALLIFIAPGFSYSQSKDEPNYYFGLNLPETKAKLRQYKDFLNYKLSYIEYDTTIELTITKDSATWIIYSVFYFDESGECYSIKNRYCGPNASKGLESILASKDYRWQKLNINKYLSKYSKSEQLEIIDDKDCSQYRRTKLNLTRKEYKQLKSRVTN